MMIKQDATLEKIKAVNEAMTVILKMFEQASNIDKKSYTDMSSEEVYESIRKKKKDD